MFSRQENLINLFKKIHKDGGRGAVVVLRSMHNCVRSSQKYATKKMDERPNTKTKLKKSSSVACV